MTSEEQSTHELVLRLMLGSDLWTDVRRAIEAADPNDTPSSKAKKAAIAVVKSIMGNIIDDGEEAVDPSLSRLGNEGLFIDSARREVAAEAHRNHIRSQFSKKTTRRQEKIQELICRVLLVASDAQTVTGTLFTLQALNTTVYYC